MATDNLFLNYHLVWYCIIADDLTRVMDAEQMRHLALLLAERSGQPLVASSLARDIQVSEPTVKKWVATLNAFYYGFWVRPWHRNIENALRKTPKWYLRDWSGDKGTDKGSVRKLGRPTLNV